MLEHFWWGSVFLLSVPAMVLLLILGPVLLPEYRDPNPGRIDPASVLLLVASLLTTVYGLKLLTGEGFGVLPVTLLLAGLALAVVFAVRQRRLTHPCWTPPCSVSAPSPSPSSPWASRSSSCRDHSSSSRSTSRWWWGCRPWRRDWRHCPAASAG
ncbi:hypothetical protein ACFQZ0_02015 [Streptomyces erythrogriseus]